MAIKTYASRGYNNGYQSGGVLSNPVGITTYASRGRSEEEDKNRGGLIGGIGYLGEKLAVGAVSSIEGISDYTFSGLAKLFGNDAWAEEIIKNDWFGDWYSHPEEWFNPDQGWQVAGDVAGGIGSSLPAMGAAVGLTLATGGLAAPAAASFLVSGLGAAGRATKEAYEQTGKLTGKEYGYGALVGATEGGVEALGNLLSLGSGAVVKSVSKAIGKETAEAFAKQGILKTLGSSFAGEAFEEGFSEWITPYWQRATYDPKAKNASADEILYASLVGGLSGVVMGGGGYVIDNVTSFSKGNKLTISGGDAQVLETSGYFSAFEDANQSGDELFSDIANKRKSLLESLSKTNGKAVTIQQKRDLGALERANIAGSMKLFVATRAQNIINNAPLIAERLTAFGYKTADGKPIRFTAEEITAGYDPKRPSSIYKAIKTNEKLRSLAVADATGRLMMDTNQFKKNALMGQKLASQVDINRFYEQASREELQAVTDALKIESWSSLTPEIFNQKITDFINDGGVEKTLQAKEKKAAFAALTQEGAQKVPKIVNLGKDGMRRYTDGQLDIAVERKGDEYTLYNYKTDNLSKGMKREDINKFLRDYSNEKEAYLAAERERLEVEQKRRAEFESLETMLRDNVSEYKTLNAPSQSMIRRLIREGRAKGVSDSDLIAYAKISAHSGIDIVFDKEATKVKNKAGEDTYRSAFYEWQNNRITVNPESKSGAERILIHELDHAVRNYFGKDGQRMTKVFDRALSETDESTQKKILEKSEEVAKPGQLENVFKDEVNSYFAERMLTNKQTLERIVEAEPGLKDKILSFFKGASSDYADVPKLSGSAKWYYKKFKKMFDEFSARNAQSNANETITSGKSDKQYAFAGVNAKIADKMKLATAEQMLKDGADSETVRRETGWFKGYDGEWRFEINDADSNLIENPTLQKHVDDGDVYFTGKLSDIFDHKELFTAYPELKNINIVIQKTELGVDAIYQPKTNYITLSIEQFKRHTKAYHDYLDGGRRAEIKSIEASEAYKEYNRLYDDDVIDKMEPTAWLEAEKTAREKFYSSDLGKRYYELNWGKSGFIGDKFEFGWSKAAKETLLHELQHAIQSREGFASGTNTRDVNYDRNAGEIEARDTARRANMTAEERKSTRPDIDRTDVVFAHDAEKSFSYIGDTKDGRRCYTSGFDKNLSMDERIELFKKRIATIFNLGAVELKTDVKKIRIIGDRFTAQKNLFGDKEGGNGEYEAKVNSLYDLADILATATYDPTATNKEPSYINPNVKPKNAAHKSVKYWYKFKNKIVFDGIPYEVTFNIRDKGKEQYQYLIDFKEDKTPGLSNTAVNNLLRADQASYMSSISQPNKKSNSSGEISLENSSGKQYALDIDSEGENIDGKVVKPEKKDGNISKIKANMLSDKVYNRGEVERAVSNVRLFKALSSKDRTRLANDLWVALNEHNRRKERVKATKEVFRKYIALVDPTKKIGINQAEIEDLAKNAVNELSKLIEGGKESYKKKIDNKVKGRIKEGVEGTQVRLKADYTTDKVFSQASVERGFAKIEAIKKIPKEVRERIARDLWLDLESSDGDDVRGILPIEYSVKLYQTIRDNDSSELTAAQRDALQRELRDTVREIVNSGRDSKWQKQKDNVRGIVRLEERVGAEYKSKIYQNLGKIKDKKYRRFTEASAYKGDVFKVSIDELTKIDWRGKFSANIARKEIKRLSEWYTEENPMLKGFETGNENSKTQHTTNFSMNIRYMLDMLSEGEGDFKNSELRMLSDVTEYFAKLVNEYDKVYVEGKWQDGEPLARELVDIVKKQDSMGVPIVVRALRNKLLSAGFRTFGDALSVMKLADMYGDGLFTRYYNEWLQGEINADAEAMKIKEKYDAFMKENPKFLKNAETETVKLHGIDVRKIDLISYAMTLKRKQAWESIAEGGVVFRDPKDGRGSHIYPTAEVAKGEGYSKRLEATMQAELDKVMSMLSEKDVQYMKVLEEGFELARTTKAMGDMQRYGFVSVIDGYYYPIKHEYTSHLSAFDVELIATDRYANASFNKSQTEGAKSAIRISSADATFNSHVKGVSRYLYLSPVMDSFNKLYKLQLNTEGNGDIITSDVRGNSYSLQSVIDQSKSAWRQDGKLVGFDYLQNLMLDTMGMGKNVGDDFAAKLRGAAVTFSLGANPKVLVTQFSSLISSTSILSYGSHFKALGIWNGNVDNYSVVAKLRNSDYTVAKAEGVIDRINTWSRVFTAGISLIDRFVVYRSWAACQAEVAKNKGPAVGTEENRVAAGKLLDKVILETQQNSLTSRRTEGARRGNILTKQMQMYKSDAITSFGRAVDGWGEMNYLGALLKSNTLTDAERATIQNRFEESKKKLAKSVGSIVGQAAFMMLVTEMFRNFYGKNDDETEEEKRTRLVVDAIGNLVNGVPVVSEVVSAITSNFGFETMEFSALNDFFDTAKGVIDYTEKRLEGKATERDGNKLMQNLLYTAGQLTGVPTRNMKNVSYGVVRLFSKDAAYKWDNAIYKKNYSADLNEAVAKGDINRATMIMELALGEKLGSGFSTEAIGELTRLAGLGEKIIPGAISDTITVNGEEFVLSAEQYEAVKAEYDKVISAVNSFIESKFYNSLTDDQRAKALRKLYSTYKDVSYDRALGTQKNPKANLISSLLGENVFNAYLTLGVIESDVDNNGNTISGSKRAKVVKAIGALGVSVEERLLLICASGYALKDGDVRGLSADGAKRRLLKYILNLRGLSADERAEIAVMCGFEVKNGRIVNNFSKKLKKLSKK